MGFPVGYTELMLPKFLLHLVFFLGYLRHLITLAFDLFGLAHLLQDSSDIPPSSTAFSPPVGAATYHSSSHHHRQSVDTTKPLFAVLIQAALPATTYSSSSATEETDDSCFCCAVCLHEFSSGEEVRRLINCRHVFHRCCLDPWVELDQRTCPLCRTPLVPDRFKDDIDRNLRADSGSVSDTDGSSNSLVSAPSAAASSYFYYDNYGDDGGDLFDESLRFVLPSPQAEPFPWTSTAVPL